jgi:hypothetical protein
MRVLEVKCIGPLRRAALVHDGLSRDPVRANHGAYAPAIDRSALSIQIASPHVDAFPLAGASPPAGEPERAPAGPHRAAARAASVANFDSVKSGACHHRSVVLDFDITHVDQGAHIIWIDRRELETLTLEVAQCPTQVDGIVQSKARQALLRFAHLPSPSTRIRILLATLQRQRFNLFRHHRDRDFVSHFHEAMSIRIPEVLRADRN